MKQNKPTKYNSVNDAANILSVGRTTIYGLLNNGELKGVKVGSRRLIPDESIVEYQEKLKRLFTT